jgi:hypothetical protein
MRRRLLFWPKTLPHEQHTASAISTQSHGDQPPTALHPAQNPSGIETQDSILQPISTQPTEDTKMTTPSEGDLKLWWVPQIPMQAFEVPVKDIDQAVLLLNTLADYDRFQLENNIKGDYANCVSIR